MSGVHNPPEIVLSLRTFLKFDKFSDHMIESVEKAFKKLNIRLSRM